jgi:hypothetical protein
MTPTNRLKNPRTMIRIGMACLAIGIVSMFVHVGDHLAPRLIDGTRGVLFGAAIGLNLAAVRLQRSDNTPR